MDITQITHPEYADMLSDYEKWRYTYEGGQAFKEYYLERLSTRETTSDYNSRMKTTYVPAFAKAAVIEIKNSIFDRLVDVSRKGGPAQYQEKTTGIKGGVDRKNSSMNSFMGSAVLPELLAMKKVGVFVDSTRLQESTGTMLDDNQRQVYQYIYKAEEIVAWSKDETGLKTVLLKATEPVENDLGLVDKEETLYRYYKRENGKVSYIVYDEKSEEAEAGVLNIPMIPIVVGELPDSILKEAADYQIAHLNMASADVNYAIKANFPFYVEQQGSFGARAQMRRANQKVYDTDSEDGTEARAGVAEGPEIRVGAVGGRTYATGAERPSFIHPSPEPLEVSMKKQSEMKREVRQLVQLAVTNMDPKRESAESKGLDVRGLEAGLSFVGQELEKMERELARLWAMYQGGEPAEVDYPENYSLKSDEQRREEAAKITETSKTSASITYQKETAKLAATIILENKVKHDTLKKIHGEIDKASVAYVDPEQLISDVEASLVTTQTAADLRGYGSEEATKAEAQRVQRAKMIVEAQASAKGEVTDGAARGVPELEADNDSANTEKKLSQDGATDLDGKKGVRGDAS